MISFIENSRRCKIIYSVKIEISGCLGPERRKRWIAQEPKEAPGKDKMSRIVTGVVVSSVHTSVKIHLIVCFKWEQFI